jgi:hypothetical protein
MLGSRNHETSLKPNKMFINGAVTSANQGENGGEAFNRLSSRASGAPARTNDAVGALQSAAISYSLFCDNL